MVPNRVLLTSLSELELLGLANKLALESLILLSLMTGRLATGLVAEQASAHLLLVLDLAGGALLGHSLVADLDLEFLLFLENQSALVPDVVYRHDDCLIRLLID